jgi:putative ABC transport system ATP-binding protein
MIELLNLHRHFAVGDVIVHALDGINLTIQKGEYVSIMGPSGSGKSTLLNVLGLLDQATSGEYRLNGRNVTTLDDVEQAKLRREQLGFVFQFFHLIPRLTAAENIELPLVLAGVLPAERKRRVDEALQSVALTDRAQHRPDQLSGGQRQRVAIARAVIMHPAIILADEPTGNLDRHSGTDVVEILESLNNSGIILIVVTHDPELGARARRKIRLVDGQVVSDET